MPRACTRGILDSDSCLLASTLELIPEVLIVDFVVELPRATNRMFAVYAAV